MTSNVGTDIGGASGWAVVPADAGKVRGSGKETRVLVRETGGKDVGGGGGGNQELEQVRPPQHSHQPLLLIAHFLHLS